MIGQLRAELLKQRSTKTTLALFAAMFGLVGLAIVLHVSTPAASTLATRSDQIPAFEVGTRVGMLFAAIAGALAITSEFRYGTINATFLVTPRRSPVIAAKLAVSALVGLVFGVVAEGLMAAAVSVALSGRGITIQLSSSDYTRLLVGGMVAAALWAVIGLGVGALVRNQIPVLIGLAVWLLVVEHALPNEALRYTPGAAGLGLALNASGTKLAGQVPALATGVLVLVGCAIAFATAGWRATLQRDVT